MVTPVAISFLQIIFLSGNAKTCDSLDLFTIPFFAAASSPHVKAKGARVCNGKCRFRTWF
jgi:hypothetical protein